MTKIPFSILPQKKLYRLARPLRGVAQRFERKIPFLEVHLKQAESKLDAIDYISMCMASSGIMLLFFFFISLPALKFGISPLLPVFIAVIFTAFMFFQQLGYPKLIASRRIRLIEQNLLPALQDMYVELNAGIPLFNILVNVSNANYGEFSAEIGRAVKEINSGRDQSEALEDLAVRNPSLLFRRSLWQIVNGMKTGADIGSLIKDVMKGIADEQLTQIQKYGGQLSPLALFYMLIAVIAPSLGTTFIIVLSSFISLNENVVKLIFYGILVMTFFMQIMFMGIIKARRPSLMNYD
ncbi:type II secretion system F family protein [Candidatus Woesearchaeota archaeon]|jgi:pilus assembly protein TadC|nr:type II secretion system F family protein [Candidatus Woesearchaeota archaeon]MBT5215283.1 type II secretion system F family protein [Candidatus Woesearchaeota archaeon]MBT6402727.1 type II secretion system F family protein [Candidatus Woesearchaeota archaeon]